MPRRKGFKVGKGFCYGKVDPAEVGAKNKGVKKTRKPSTPRKPRGTFVPAWPDEKNAADQFMSHFAFSDQVSKRTIEARSCYGCRHRILFAFETTARGYRVGRCSKLGDKICRSARTTCKGEMFEPLREKNAQGKEL